MKAKLYYLTILSVFLLMLFSCSINVTEKEKKYYTVSFDSDGGSNVNSQTVEEGKNAIKPTNPTKEGFSFEG